MEYLMTYGWAILIVSIVLGSLWSMGVFSANSAAGRAPPGLCRVFRPSGSVSNTLINLVGVCTSQPPQYIASFSGTTYGSGSSFAQNYAYIPNFFNTHPITDLSTFTLNLWVYANPPSDMPSHNNEILLVTNDDNAFQFRLIWSAYSTSSGSGVSITTTDGNNNYYGSVGTAAGVLGFGGWHMISLTHAAGAGAFSIFIDGVQSTTAGQAQTWGTATINSIATTGNLILYSRLYCCDVGPYSSWGTTYEGDASYYNTTLSATQIASLYAEGVGGVPTALANLVGWWPLNGNANDYSGNNNNGAPANVIFISSWTK
jgi:hypothetical protein